MSVDQPQEAPQAPPRGDPQEPPTATDQVARRLHAVRERIAGQGVDPATVEIVAVTKFHDASACRAAVAAGLTTLGENRVQEALSKMDQVPGAAWHLIGHLQTNKARAAGRFALIQSLDSVRLADTLAERAPAVPVLVEVNVSRDAEKSGVEVEDALDLVVHAASRLTVAGLMGMGPRGGRPPSRVPAPPRAPGAGPGPARPAAARPLHGDDPGLRGRGPGGQHDGASGHHPLRSARLSYPGAQRPGRWYRDGVMVVVSGLLSAVALVVVLFEICLLGRAVFSWIEPIPRNRVNRFFIQVTEPVVRPVRRVIPPLGGLDLSVLVVFIGLGIILRILTSYGAVVPFPF